MTIPYREYIIKCIFHYSLLSWLSKSLFNVVDSLGIFRFASPEGDHVMLLNVFRAYRSATQKKVWCHENFLHHRNLEYASEVRQQLAALAERANLEKASCGTNTKQLRKAFLEGLYENLAELQRDQTYVTVSNVAHNIISIFSFYIFLIVVCVVVLS